MRYRVMATRQPAVIQTPIARYRDSTSARPVFPLDYRSSSSPSTISQMFVYPAPSPSLSSLHMFTLTHIHVRLYGYHHQSLSPSPPPSPSPVVTLHPPPAAVPKGVLVDSTHNSKPARNRIIILVLVPKTESCCAPLHHSVVSNSLFRLYILGVDHLLSLFLVFYHYSRRLHAFGL